MRSREWKQVAENGFDYEIIYKDLDESSALRIETDLINNPDPSWSIVNKRQPIEGTKCLKDSMELFKYSSTSPSGLVYAIDVYGGAGYCKIQVTQGSCAGSLSREGYWKVKTKNGLVSAHRVVYALFHGHSSVKDKVVNHIDNNPSNNLISNLEVVSVPVNARRKKNNNSKTRTDNRSGVNGVCLSTSRLGHQRCIASVVDIMGIDRSKSFSLLKYGKEEAFRLACEWRKEQIELLNSQGAGYTERHGT